MSRARLGRWTSLVAGVAIAATAVGAPSGLAAPVVEREPIIGGTAVTSPATYPFSAALVTPFGAQFCGGALIAQDWVLTAAHCVESFTVANEVLDPSEVRVITGHPDLGAATAADRLQVSQIISHPLWRTEDPIPHDIALIELSAPAPLGSPIRVPEPADASLWALGQSGTVMGWGATNPNGTQSSSVLREVDVPHRSDAQCAGSGYDPALSLCAGGVAGEDSCSGDSGGPLISPASGGVPRVVGIVSSGPDPCAQAGLPAQYTEVAAFIPWLETNSGLDLTAPTVTVEQAAGQLDPTEERTVMFTVTFSEPVGGLADGDVVIGGTAGAATATVTGSGSVYTVTVSGATQNGTIVASVRAGATADLAGNPSRASTSIDNVVTTAILGGIDRAARATAPAERLGPSGG